MYQRVPVSHQDDTLIDSPQQNDSMGQFNSTSPHHLLINANNTHTHTLNNLLKIQLTWKNISAYAEEIKQINGHKIKTQKSILNNMSGTVQPGQFLTILGSTGAGKTTLLNILSGRCSSSNIIKKGTVLINGVPIECIDHTRFTAFFYQNDQTISNLTVRECLTFAAKCKCPGDDEFIRKRVDDIITELSLAHIKNERMNGNISRGEIIRTSLGIELITNPQLIFLDEPTSGMDSMMALKMVEIMANAAKKGATVIAVLHQPSSLIYQLFDQLMLMSLGNTIYFNSVANAKQYFDRINFPFEEHTNPAEHLMEIVSYNSLYNEQNPEIDGLSDLNENKIKSQYNSLISDLANKYIEMTEFSCDGSFACANLTDIQQYKFEQHSTPWCQQFINLIKREYVLISRNIKSAVIKCSICFFLSVLMIMLYYKMDILGYKGFQNISGYFMVASLNLIVVGIVNATDSFATSLATFLKEQTSGLYCVSAYYASYTLSSMILTIFIPTLHILIGFLIVFAINGMEVTVSKFLTFWIASIVVYMTAEAYGVLIIAIVKDRNRFVSIFSVSFAPIWLLSGYFVNLSKVVHVVRELQYVSIFKYAYNIFGRVN